MRSPARFPLLGCCLALALGAAPALAEEPAMSGEQTVTLVNGSVFRGELVEMVPEDHITIKLATGEIKRFSWFDILPPPAGAQTAPMVPTQPDGALPARPPSGGNFGGGVRIHIDADNPDATLFKIKGSSTAIVPDGDGGWTEVANESRDQVCRAPCDLRVDPNFPYRIGGPGISQSRSIRLPVSADSINLHVKTGSQKARGAAAGLLILGAPALVVAGAAMLTAAAFTFRPPPDSLGTPNALLAMQMADADSQRSLFYTLGGVITGLGVAALVTGIVLWTTGRTRVRASSGESLNGLRGLPPAALAWLPSVAHE